MSNVAVYEVSDGIGLRDLRARLSSLVGEVKEGRSFTVTEHGRPVARLVPVVGQSNYERLIAQGVVQPAARRVVALDPPVLARAGVSDLVADQRP